MHRPRSVQLVARKHHSQPPEATALILRYHELADRTIDVSFFRGNGGKEVQGYRRIDRTLKVRSFFRGLIR